MRWKLLRRRLSISAPRMAIRSQLPWPLRWAVLAVMLGFSAAIALWAFEFGREIAGLDRGAMDERQMLREELSRLREQLDRAQAIANTADSLLKTERTAQERLAAQLKQLETDNLALKGDLAFFERLMPVGAQDANRNVAVRGFLVEAEAKGKLRYQLLVMRQGRPAGVLGSQYELTVTGTLNDQPWSWVAPGGPKALDVRQYARVEGRIPGAGRGKNRASAGHASRRRGACHRSCAALRPVRPKTHHSPLWAAPMAPSGAQTGLGVLPCGSARRNNPRFAA